LNNTFYWFQLTKILQENEKTSIYPYFNYKNEWNCEKRRNFAFENQRRAPAFGLTRTIFIMRGCFYTLHSKKVKREERKVKNENSALGS
jgi:hypothetical protein